MGSLFGEGSLRMSFTRGNSFSSSMCCIRLSNCLLHGISVNFLGNLLHISYEFKLM